MLQNYYAIEFWTWLDNGFQIFDACGDKSAFQNKKIHIYVNQCWHQVDPVSGR